jgi:proteasome lid subunit RPN8/RPN11
MIVAEAKRSVDALETGGILLGDDTIHVPGPHDDAPYVRHAGGPGPAAVRKANYFRPDYVHAQRDALDAFETDGSNWIGTWHTHPGLGPLRHTRPSAVDLRVYRQHLADKALGLTRFVALIVTPPPFQTLHPNRPWKSTRVTPWIVTKRWTNCTSLHIIEEAENR